MVISGQIGEGMIASLALKGIKAIVETETKNVHWGHLASTHNFFQNICGSQEILGKI